MRRNKYGNKKVISDGFTFDSKAEYRRYQQLKLLQQAGEISGLKVHPPFRLIPSFTDGSGKRHRAVFYEADFSYTENGTEVVEDVKGVRTAVFKLKHKLLLYRHPGLDFRIVEARHV
jgi:hypothetical protein